MRILNESFIGLNCTIKSLVLGFYEEHWKFYLFESFFGV